MKIDNYSVKTSSSYSYEKVQSQFTYLAVNGKGSQATENTDDEANAIEDGEPGAAVSLTDPAKKAINDWKEAQEKSLGFFETKMGNVSKRVANSKEDIKMTLLDYMLSALTGKKVSSRMVDMSYESSSFDFQAFSMNANSAPPRRINNIMTFTTDTITIESESVSYNAKGIINTADGRQITVDIDMNLSRELFQYESANFSIDLTPCDPLIINYAGTAASLTDEKYEFDLNCDGKKDQISFAGQGQGFLALDKNGDGIINDGSELFGPQSGNGFGDLRAYDLDGNGWIDENDDIFDQLVVWTKDADGNDQLFKLKDLDIGAIYLGETSTQFGFYGADGQSQGDMRSTSFFLKESGGAGTLSHVDLSI